MVSSGRGVSVALASSWLILPSVPSSVIKHLPLGRFFWLAELLVLLLFDFLRHLFVCRDFIFIYFEGVRDGASKYLMRRASPSSSDNLTSESSRPWQPS